MKRSEYIIKRRTPKRKPSMLPGFIGFACVAVFSVYAFVFSDDAMASRTIAPVAAQISMPTAHELTVLERRLKKTTHNSPSAETCMRGQILGGTEIHFAMNFAPQGRPATRQNPGLARAHAEKASDTEKVLVLESKDPTVWEVTGKPSAIVLLGKAVISDYPEGTRVFAPAVSPTALPRFQPKCSTVPTHHGEFSAVKR